MDVARARISVDEVIRTALLKAAEAGEVKLTGQTDALFTSASGANRDAIAACKNAANPLLLVVGREGRAEFVALAPAGFERIAGDIPEEKVGAVARRVASTIPTAGRIDFIQDTIRRTPLAAAELTPLLEEAVAAEKAEREARVAVAAKRRAAEEAAKQAIERALQLFEQRKQNRLDALRREWEAEGEDAADLPPRDPHPKRETAATTGATGSEPVTDEEKDFRRDVAGQLAASWRAAWDAKKAEGLEHLESAMWNVRGLKLIGEPGQEVAYSGRVHESVAGVGSGDRVRIVRPGWVLAEESGDYTVLKATVEK